MQIETATLVFLERLQRNGGELAALPDADFGECTAIENACAGGLAVFAPAGAWASHDTISLTRAGRRALGEQLPETTVELLGRWWRDAVTWSLPGPRYRTRRDRPRAGRGVV